MLPHILSFKGRIKRGEYAATLIPVVITNRLMLDDVIILEPLLALFISVMLMWILAAQGAKRCHDLDGSGWHQLIPFFPFVLMSKKGAGLINRFGPPPP